MHVSQVQVQNFPTKLVAEEKKRKSCLTREACKIPPAQETPFILLEE